MTRPMTAEDLLQPDVPEHAELVRGVPVVREPPGFRHGEMTVRLASALMIHVDAHNLGRVVGGDAGFQLQSDPEVWTAGAVSRGRHGQWEWNVEGRYEWGRFGSAPISAYVGGLGSGLHVSHPVAAPLRAPRIAVERGP